MLSELSNMSGEASHNATWIYPLCQMGSFGIRQDEVAMLKLFQSVDADTTVALGTGYFNLTC